VGFALSSGASAICKREGSDVGVGIEELRKKIKELKKEHHFLKNDSPFLFKKLPIFEQR